MAGSKFATAVLAAMAPIDDFMAEDFAVQPMLFPSDVNAPAGVDTARPTITVRGVFVDPEAKPTMANSYDPRQVRRPGVEGGHPRILLTPATVAALPTGFGFQKSDQLTQTSTGRIFAVSTSFLMAGGSMKLLVNLIG